MNVFSHVALGAILFTACSKDTGVDTANFSISDFSGGTFQVTTIAVADGCMDGAFDLIFMPEGSETPSDWSTTTEFPAFENLPSTYEIALQEPFSSMEVTVSESATGLRVGDAAQSGVELDEETWPGCMVDMSIEADLMVQSDTQMMGSATLTTSSFDEDNCPAISSEPCEIVLDLTISRIE